jgi:xylulokinase
MFSLSKLLWLKDHQPDVYRRTWKFLCYEDLVIHQLGLPPTTDYTVASRTLCFDIIAKDWSGEIMEVTGLDVNKFPRVVPSGTPVGTISPRMAEALSLPHDVVVVTGGHDHPCGALGAGVRKPGVALESIGTVDCLAVLFDTPRLGRDMLDQGFPCYPHTIPELYVTLAFNFTGGSVLRWFRDTLGDEERRLAREQDQDVYSLLLAQARKSRSPVAVLPYFTSSGTPYMDPHALGAMLGFTFNTTKADLIRGCLEGVVLEMKLNLATLEAAGIPVEEVRTIGGGARSREWLQMRADAYNTRVVALDVSEAACLGAAILAGTGAGVFESVPRGVEATVREKETLFPREEVRGYYQEQFEVYRTIYPAVKDLTHRIKRLQAQRPAPDMG